MAEAFDVLTVSEYTDNSGTKKSRWTRIGVAFQAKDGEGFNAVLEATPVNGKIVIRRKRAEEGRQGYGSAAPTGRATNDESIPF